MKKQSWEDKSYGKFAYNKVWNWVNCIDYRIWMLKEELMHQKWRSAQWMTMERRLQKQMKADIWSNWFISIPLTWINNHRYFNLIEIRQNRFSSIFVEILHMLKKKKKTLLFERSKSITKYKKCFILGLYWEEIKCSHF